MCLAVGVAVLVPCNPQLSHELKVLMIKNLRKMVDSNPTLSLDVIIDSGPMAAQKGSTCLFRK